MAHLPRRSPVRALRGSFVAAVVLGAAALGATPALAAPASTSVDLGGSPARVVVDYQRPPSGGANVPIGYGGQLTIQLPPTVTPAAGATFDLDFTDPDYPFTWAAAPGFASSFSTADGAAAPLTVTDLGGNAFRIDIPASSAVDATAPPLEAFLIVSPIATSLTNSEIPNPQYEVNLDVSAAGPATASVQGDLVVNSYLPDVSASAGSTVDLTLPTSSAQYQAGLTSLAGTTIALNHANAGNLVEDFGPDLQPAVTVSADGLSAGVVIPADTPSGVYALTVQSSQPVAAWFGVLVQVTGLNAGLRSETGWAGHADGGGTPWLPEAGGTALLLLAGGTALVVRRRSARA